MKSTITKLIPVAALCALGVMPVLAQTADEEKEQKQREEVQAQAERAAEQAERAQEQAARVRERVQLALEKSQEDLNGRLNQVQDHVNKIVTRAGKAFQLAQRAPAKVPAPGEIPEPPEPPGAVGFDLVQNIDDQVQMRFDHGNGNFNWFGPGQPAVQPLIVNVSDPSPAKLTETQEDLNVMTRILKKAAGRAAGRDKHEDEAAAMGIVLSNVPGGRRADSMYLEGYGAMFMLNVRFPLVAPAEVEEKKVEKAPDTTWEKTKRELYGPRASVINGGKIDMFFANGNGGGPAMVYEAERVDSLKQELLAALKNGANLRHVKPDEYVTIAVTGGAASTGNVTVQKVKPGKVRKKIAPPEPRDEGEEDVKSAAPQVEVLTMSAPGGTPGRQSNLIIRARKSDIDAFAKGDLDLAAFTKKASAQAY